MSKTHSKHRGTVNDLCKAEISNLDYWRSMIREEDILKIRKDHDSEKMDVDVLRV
jgi:hypothetical protein